MTGLAQKKEETMSDFSDKTDPDVNEDGTRNLLAGPTLHALCTAIMARPGVTVKELCADFPEVKPSTLAHHVERLHLRLAIRRLPTGEPAAGPGRGPTGIHWTGAYRLINAEEARKEAKEAKSKGTGAPRVRTPATPEACLQRATDLEAKAALSWQGFAFEGATKSAFETLVTKVCRMVEAAARLRFMASTAIPQGASMTFAPEPPPAPEETPAAAPEGVEAPKSKKGKKGAKAVEASA